MTKKRFIKIRQKILNLINTSVKRRGHPPTVRELAKFINRSLTATHHHLKSLRDDGHIKFRRGNKKRVSRGLKTKTVAL